MGKTIDEIIKEGGKINYDVKTPKSKKEIFFKVITWPLKKGAELFLSMFGINIERIKEENSTVIHSRPGNYGHGPSDFRSGYKVNSEHQSPFTPYGFDPIQAENLKIYMEGMDGKGDNDCDCR